MFSDSRDSLLIFLFSFIIYIANGKTISAGDTIPNTVLAFNVLANHTLHLDIFRQSYLSNSYAFVEANNGHLSSIYPIGSAIVSFPLYLIFYLYSKIVLIPLDMTSANFEPYRLLFEKLAASFITSATVVIFYLSSIIKFDRKTSLISTFIFAFATNTWMTSSQGLWQHGVSNFILVVSIFSLLKFNQNISTSKFSWLLLAGICCGLLPGIRPTSILFSVNIIVYAIFIYRINSIFVFLGCLSSLPSILWNLYYFGNFSGGYSSIFPEAPYLFTLDNFTNAFLGTLLSPSRGLIIFSPIVLYCLPVFYKLLKLRSRKDDLLLGSLSITSLCLVFSYFFYIVWWAGHSYGPRFMTDVMPIFCYLINYYFYSCSSLNSCSRLISLLKLSSVNTHHHFILFFLVIFYSTFIQFIGAFGTDYGYLWNGIPLNVDIPEYQYRLWSWSDSQIQRHCASFFYEIFGSPVKNNQISYKLNLDGLIKNVLDKQNHPLSSHMLVAPGHQQLIKADLKNLGDSTWFGYDSAIGDGEVRVRCIFYDLNDKTIEESRLYISGVTRSSQLAEAFGHVVFPVVPGDYILKIDLVSEGFGNFGDSIKYFNVRVQS